MRAGDCLAGRILPRDLRRLAELCNARTALRSRRSRRAPSASSARQGCACEDKMKSCKRVSFFETDATDAPQSFKTCAASDFQKKPDGSSLQKTDTLADFSFLVGAAAVSSSSP